MSTPPDAPPPGTAAGSGPTAHDAKDNAAHDAKGNATHNGPGPRPRGLQPATTPPAAAGGLLDTLRVGVVMLDTRGRVVLWSPLAEEILGWAGEHIVGRRIDHIISDWSTGQAVRAERLGKIPSPGPAEQVLAELLRAGRWGGVLPLRHRDGHTVQAEVRASLLVDGDGKPYILVSLAETQLLRGLEHDLAIVDAVFDTSALGIAIFDIDLRFVRVNEALARMNGWPADDHIGRTVEEILPGKTGEELTLVQREVLATGRTVVDLLNKGPGGEGLRSASYARIIDRAGQVLGISCIVMDVTERHTAVAKAERARTRLSLLNDVGAILSDLLDVDRIARLLPDILVPEFADYAGVLLVRDVPSGGDLPRRPHPPDTPLVLAGVCTGPGTEAVAAKVRAGATLSFPAGSPLTDVLAGGPAWYAETSADLHNATDTMHGLDPRIKAALELGVGSLLVVSLRARGIVLGLLVIGRSAERESFDPDDLALATELADRAGAALDNARLYAREREGALMLQRSLLPQHVPELPGVEVAYRYVPGSTGAEAGGDWFDVVPLAGGRVAFVVGDVMGHGLQAAATMGRLRTAMRTLAGLDMPPDELLRRINDLSEDFAQFPDEPMMATCVYAVYDPSTRICSIAKAGHLPPLLIDPGERGAEGVHRLDMPAGTPIGIGEAEFETTELRVPDGSVLVLYTDGLVERRGEDITRGIDRLGAVLGRSHRSLDDACDEMVADLVSELEPDDVAVLMARLGGLPEGSAASWVFPAEPSAVRQARTHVRETLAAWGLNALTDVTVLLVSELVTNSLRYAHGPIGVRMVRGPSLLVEVSDPLPDPPRARTADHEDEGGRGLQLVARASRRWGTRQGPLGKTVWFELALPGS
ncbi:SpoIIE family protein phosphatase [Streptomyces sp. NPDC054933]